MRSIHHFQIATLVLTLVGVGFELFCCGASLGNPIPQGTPYILMTKEEMSISISDDYTVTMKGVYTFDVVYMSIPEQPGGPPWDYIMYFPAPPEARNISIVKNGVEPLQYCWTEEEYITTVDDLIGTPPLELHIWPMFAWDVSLDTGRVEITVTYEHDLVQVRDGRWALVYSLGTGRYTEGWYPPFPGLPGGKPYVNVTIDVLYPSTLLPVACSPMENYDPTVVFTPTLSWKAYNISPLNDFITLFGDQSVRGNVNGDHAINVLDVVSVIIHILGIKELDSEALLRADCNGDGEVNISDCIGIVNVILGIGVCEPAAG